MMQENKKKCLSVFGWTIKKYIPFSIAYWVLLFLCLPMVEIILLFLSVVTGSIDYGIKIEQIMPVVPTTFFTFIAIVFSTIIAIMAFSYQHNKRSMDFFGSLPVSRRSMFFSRYMAAVMLSVVPVIVMILLAIVLGFNVAAAVSALKTLGLLTLAIIGNISIIGIISVCCGTVVDIIISYLILNVIYPIVVAIFYFFPMMSLPGATMSMISGIVFTLLSPIATAYTGYFCDETWLYVVWWLVLSAVAILGCYVLTKKRKTETAQNAFSFKIPEIVIKIFTDFAGGFGLGILFLYIGVAAKSVVAQYVWFWIGFLFGACIAHILLHLIFNRGLSKFTKSFPQFLTALVCGVIFFVIIVTGGFGYVNRVPDIDKVSKVSISSELDSKFTVNGENIFAPLTSDKETIKATKELHEEIINELHSTPGLMSLVREKAMFDDTDDYEENDEGYIDGDITITYEMKNGTKIKRYYTQGEYDSAKVNGILKNVSDRYSMDEQEYAFAKIPKKLLSSLEVYMYPEGKAEKGCFAYGDNQSERINTEIYDTLKADYEKYGKVKKTQGNTYYTVTIDFSNINESYSMDVTVDDTYINTMKVLKKYNISNKMLAKYKSNNITSDCIKDDFTYSDGNKVYFEMPKDWDKNRPVYFQVLTNDDGYGSESVLYYYGVKECRCEKVTDNIYSFNIPDKTTIQNESDKFSFDKIMFYQITDDDMNVTGFVPYNNSKNLLTVSDFLGKSRLSVANDTIINYNWSTYKN